MKRLLPLVVTVAAFGCQRAEDSASLSDLTNTKIKIERPQRVGTRIGPRWPSENDGKWVSADDERLVGFRLSDLGLVPLQPLPEWGYVPIEATAPTLRCQVHNETRLEVANIRLRVQAVRDSDGAVLADELTDIPGKYRTTLPHSVETRKFVLRDDGAFLDCKNWNQFSIKASLDGVRVWNSRTNAAEEIEP